MITYRYKAANLLFVGINPHPGSFRRGIPFSNNKLFWYLLSDAGILKESRAELRNDSTLLQVYKNNFGHSKLGLINLIEHPTVGVSELKRGDEERGVAQVHQIIQTEKPTVVCFVGKVTYQTFMNVRTSTYGWQTAIGASRVFLMHYPQHGPAAIRVHDLQQVAAAAHV